MTSKLYLLESTIRAKFNDIVLYIDFNVLAIAFLVKDRFRVVSIGLLLVEQRLLLLRLSSRKPELVYPILIIYLYGSDTRCL